MKRIIPMALLLCLSIAACKTKGESKNQNVAPTAVFTTDSVQVTDTMKTQIGGEEAAVDYSLIMDYPTKGDAATLKWLQQWMALEVAGKNDSLPASMPHVSALYDKAKDVYHGSLGEPKKMGEFEKNKLFNLFKEEAVKPALAMNYSDQLNVRLCYQTQHVATFLTTGYSYRGGAHGMPMNQYTVFDLDRKTSLTTSDMFRPEKMNKVRAAVVKGLCEYFKVKDFAALKEQLMTEPVELKSENDLPLPQFTPGFTPKGIVFVYQSYEIACYAAGQPTATVSYKDLWDCLTPRVQKIMDEVQ